MKCAAKSGTIVDTLAMDRKVYYKGDRKHYSLEEASEYMYQNLQDAYESSQNGIHLIKAQTALGKTTQYIKLIKENPMQKFIIAVLTNMLKKEVAGRLSTALSHAYLLQMAYDFLKEYMVIIDEDILLMQILGRSLDLGVHHQPVLRKPPAVQAGQVVDQYCSVCAVICLRHSIYIRIRIF